LANSEKLETMVAGKAAEFINRHIYPPNPGTPGLKIYSTLIQNGPFVKWLQVVQILPSFSQLGSAPGAKHRTVGSLCTQ
jgi:hypothetical protein